MMSLISEINWTNSVTHNTHNLFFFYPIHTAEPETSHQRERERFALLAVLSVDTSVLVTAHTFSLTYKHNLYPLSSQCCVNSPQRSPPLLIRLWRNSNGAFVLCGRDNLIHSCRGLLLQPTAAASQSEMRRHSRIPTTHRNHLYLIQYQ